MQRDSNAPHHQDTKLTPDSGCVFPTAPAIAGMHDILAAGPATCAASPTQGRRVSPSLSLAQKKPFLASCRGFYLSFSRQLGANGTALARRGGRSVGRRGLRGREGGQ